MMTKDYGLVDRMMWNEIELFKIDRRIESDHMPNKIEFTNEMNIILWEKGNKKTRIMNDWSETGIKEFIEKLLQKKNDNNSKKHETLDKLQEMIDSCTKNKETVKWKEDKET